MSRKQSIKEIILQQHNSTKLDRLTPRDLELPIDTEKIIVVSGVRRCGKTSLLKQTRNLILKNNVPLNKTLFFSFDDERLMLQTEELDLIMQAYRELYPNHNMEECYFFFDEIQNIDHWDKFVRRIYDNETQNIFISGSNSKQLGSEIATSLRGRTLLYELFPLDFSEYLTFKKIDKNYKGDRQKALMIHEFNLFLKQGGFPECISRTESQRNQILADYYQVLLFRDIVERYGVTRIFALKYFIQKLMGNISTPFSLNKIYNELKSQGVKVSKDTLYEILEYIEAVYLGIRLYKFDYSVVNREMGDKKIYSIDNGLLSVISYQFSDNHGRLLENLVFVWLRKLYGDSLFYYNQKTECDFIVFDRDQPIQAIQVCFDLGNADTRKREINGLAAAMDYFNLSKGVIITMDQEEELEKDGKSIRVMPAYQLMIENKKL
jgi:predicted AAA+ superfamily ATPase